MPRRHSSCSESSPCRLEWRPSRWQALAQGLCAALAVVACWRTQLPWGAAAVASLMIVVLGLHGVRVYLRQAARSIEIPPGTSLAWIDGQMVEALDVHWQGPLVQLRWRCEGRAVRCLFWPDTLPAPQRRELRLAMRARRVPRRPRSMAP